MLKAFTATLFTIASIGSAVSAQSFEDVLARAQGSVGDIGKFQQALQNPDLRLQYAMVQEMLKLDDPALQRLAKEHALFSTNPVMREAAIKAIMDSGVTLRIQVAGIEGSYENTARWADYFGGTFIKNRGEALVVVPSPVGDACWGTERHCTFRQVGSTVQYNPLIPNWHTPMRAVLTLGNDGVLRGTTSDKVGETLQIQIDLKE